MCLYIANSCLFLWCCFKSCVFKRFSTRVNVHSTPGVRSIYTAYVTFHLFLRVDLWYDSHSESFRLVFKWKCKWTQILDVSLPVSRVCIFASIYIFLQFEISNSELCVPGRAVFTVELYLQTERVLIVGAETQETQHDWIQALTKVTHFAYSTYAQNKNSFISLFFTSSYEEEAARMSRNYSTTMRYFFHSPCDTSTHCPQSVREVITRWPCNNTLHKYVPYCHLYPFNPRPTRS